MKQDLARRLDSWRHHHRQSLLDALGRFRHGPVGALLTVLVIGVALALPGVLYAVLVNLEQMSATWRERASHLSLYLDENIRAENANALLSQVRGWPEISEARLITPEQGLRELEERLGIQGTAASLGHNPLPTVLILHPSPAYSDSQHVDSLRERAGTLSGVARVSRDADWLDRLETILAGAREAALLISWLLGASVAFVIGNTVRLELQDRIAEVRLVQLIGGTRRFIRRPLLYVGLIQGALGGLAAGLIVSLMLALLNAPLVALTQGYGLVLPTDGLPVIVLASLIAGGGLLGWLGAWITATFFLRRLSTE
ncbi:MAG: permease-like cell division protein FtsX [Halothiobacillaceae bacterium]|nr:permease-like cell division protein FtsX [Halothiobacillaceae bacterium]